MLWIADRIRGEGKEKEIPAVQGGIMGFYPTKQWLMDLGFLLEVIEHCKKVW